MVFKYIFYFLFFISLKNKIIRIICCCFKFVIVYTFLTVEYTIQFFNSLAALFSVL